MYGCIQAKEGGEMSDKEFSAWSLILSIVGAIILIVAASLYSYFFGRREAFQDISLEKCWLQKPEQEIACYIETE